MGQTLSTMQFPPEGPSSDPIDATQQLLRYAQELHHLHEIQRATGEQLEAAQQAMLDAHQQQLAIIADLKRVYEAERQAREDLRDAYIATIRVLAAAVEAKDDYTGGHVERVRHVSMVIGRELDVPEQGLAGLDVGAILHDVGKVGVPDSVLTKPGALDAEDWRLMKQHPAIGTRLLQNVPFLLPALEVVANHHERWDGSGYPAGLRGEAIPLAGRIVAVADAFDALTTDRIYRGRRTLAAAVDELERCSGQHFDPTVVGAFIRALNSNRL